MAGTPGGGGAVGRAVLATVAGHNLMPAGVLPRDLDGVLDRLHHPLQGRVDEDADDLAGGVYERGQVNAVQQPDGRRSALRGQAVCHPGSFKPAA